MPVSQLNEAEIIAAIQADAEPIAVRELPEEQIESIFCRNPYGVERTYYQTHQDVRWFKAQHAREQVRPAGPMHYAGNPSGRFVLVIVTMKQPVG